MKPQPMNPYLPELAGTEQSELGRITKSIVLALKAKVLVTAASPLFNGNADFVGLQTQGKDGGELLINPVADPKKMGSGCHCL